MTSVRYRARTAKRDSVAAQISSLYLSLLITLCAVAINATYAAPIAPKLQLANRYQSGIELGAVDLCCTFVNQRTSAATSL